MNFSNLIFETRLKQLFGYESSQDDLERVKNLIHDAIAEQIDVSGLEFTTITISEDRFVLGFDDPEITANDQTVVYVACFQNKNYEYSCRVSIKKSFLTGNQDEKESIEKTSKIYSVEDILDLIRRTLEVDQIKNIETIFLKTKETFIEVIKEVLDEYRKPNGWKYTEGSLKETSNFFRVFNSFGLLFHLANELDPKNRFWIQPSFKFTIKEDEKNLVISMEASEMDSERSMKEKLITFNEDIKAKMKEFIMFTIKFYIINYAKKY